MPLPASVGWWREEAFSFLSEPGVQIYLGLLGLAAWSCFRCHHGRTKDNDKRKEFWASSSQSIDDKLDKTSPGPCRQNRHVPTLLSPVLIAITWWYIIRFILTHQKLQQQQQQEDSSYFDDAYKDVLNTPNLYFTSTQLLTWAIVAVVWIAHQESANDALPFLVFGFFGAMSASYMIWIPSWRCQNKNKTTGNMNSKSGSSSGIPMTIVLATVLAYVAILHLTPCHVDDDNCTFNTGYGSFDPSFSFWLHTLHVILLIPVGLEKLVSLPRVPVAPLYAILTVVFGAWHLYQLMFLGRRWNLPQTDCQWSITIDLIVCTLLTLWFPLQSSSSQQYLSSWVVGAFLAAMFSPAAVLAGQLLRREWPGVVAHLQRAVAQRRETKGRWCNLGLWKDDNDADYQSACERLALALGQAAALVPQSSVLSCGCGNSTRELEFWKTRFDLHDVTGIDPSEAAQRDSLPPDFVEFNVRRIRAGVRELLELECLAKHSFDALLALDNVYHYTDKTAFFSDASRMIRRGTGVVAVTDLLWNDANAMPIWMGWMLALMGVSSPFVWNESTYRQELSNLGYRNIRITRIGKQVFQGWDFIPQFLRRRLDYVILVADAPAAAGPAKRKKRIAIVGSGMAGLAASHFITSSARGSDVEVDIYEARPVVGLAGDTICFQNQMIDVPPRMASDGYYRRYLELVSRLRVATRVVETGCNFYGDAKKENGQKKKVFHGVESSQLRNIWNAMTLVGLHKVSQVLKGCSVASIKAAIDNSLTFGEWMEQHFEIPLSLHQIGKDNDLPTLTCSDSPFLYMMIGSLSWMLSCTYEQLIAYPANIVLSYFSLTEWTGFGLFVPFQVVRIDPSIKALEKALLYGVHKLSLSTRVTEVDEKKTIHGTKYDAVICATEAFAVSKVVKHCSDVFSQIRYEPSCIYMHHDESFMPPNRRDWKCWNVEMSSGRANSELTFWLNEFYPDAKFTGNVFETWAPRRKPREDRIIKRSDFQRVIHSQDTKNMIREIEREQGKGGIFYAGSYSVYGMGLLEEALASGDLAAANTLKYLFSDDD